MDIFHQILPKANDLSSHPHSLLFNDITSCHILKYTKLLLGYFFLCVF